MSPWTFLDIGNNNCQFHSFLVIIALLPLSENCGTIINDPIKFVFNFHKVLVSLTTNFLLNITFLIYNNNMFISGYTEVFTCFIRCKMHQSVQYITFFNICNSEIENFKHHNCHFRASSLLHNVSNRFIKISVNQQKLKN